MSEVRLRKGLTSLREKFPELAAQWHPTLNAPLTPDNTSYGSKKKVWWSGACGHTWDSGVNERAVAGNGCPYCAGMRVLVGFNDLATLRPDVAALWNTAKNGDLSPQQVTTRTNKRVHWLCAQGHESFLAVAEMTREGRKCAYCSGRKIKPGENDLASLYPDLALQCVNSEDKRVSPGSRKIVEWQCIDNPLHKTWLSTVKDRVRGSGCPSCSGRVVVAGVNDLAFKRPDLLSQWSSENVLRPDEVSYGSHYKALWECVSGHTWTAPVHARAIAGYGCSVCKSSTGEQSIYDYIVDLMGGDQSLVKHHDKSVLPRKELDIYVPSKKIAVEFNGIYWHSETKIADTKYHYDKWSECANQGIQLIQIWEDEWNSSPGLIKRILANKLGVSSQDKVPARSTTVASITMQESDAFLHENHIQGAVTGSSYLALKDQQHCVVAVLVLRWKDVDNGIMEISRYATNKNVQGGFTKLLKHAERTLPVKTFVTFSDHCISDGGLYRSTGFTMDAILKEDYRYVVNGQRRHKFGYRLKRFENDPSLQYVKGLSERELAALNEIPRIWDAGKTKWVKDVK